MRKYKNISEDLPHLIGVKINMLTLLSFRVEYNASQKKNYIWVTCVCDCGVTKELNAYNYITNKVISCGCHRSKTSSQRILERCITHNKTHSLEYKSYHSMIQRCYNPKCASFPNYGARGIIVCDRWLKSFENFFDDMGERPSKEYSLDRINVEDNYTPENCKWSNFYEQANNRRNTVFITYNSQTKALGHWAKEFNISLDLIRYRLNKKYPINKLFLKPKKYKLNEKTCDIGV